MNNFKVFLQIAILSFTFLSYANDNKPNSILLVIDMQKDLLTHGKSGMDLDSSQISTLIQNVNENIALADSLNIPVAYIQNLWTNPLWIYFSGNVCRKGDKDSDFDPRLITINKNVYEKTVPNAFSNKKLADFIKENQIRNIFICGIKTEACVSATVKNSLKMGYKTFIIAPAIGANSLERLHKDIVRLQKLGAIKINKINEKNNQ